MVRAPLPHQSDALLYTLSRQRIALFMEMRLGKTLVAIRWAQMQAAYPVLVIAPLTVLPAWESELLAEGVPAEHILIYGQRKSCIRAEGWGLINYEQIRAHPAMLAAPWGAIICDESTRLRNPKAQITKLVCLRTAHIPRKAILSGLPAPESPLDYFCQYHFLYGSFLGFYNYWGFRLKYFQSDSHGWEWWPKPGTIERIKEAVHHSAFVLTRKQAKIGSRKIYESRHIPLTPSQRRIYQKAEDDFVLELKHTEKETIWNTTKLLWLMRIAGGYSAEDEDTIFSTKKTDELLALLTGELRQESVVVWFRFNREIAEARARIKERTASITGATPLDERKRQLQSFQRGETRILLAQVKCAKFGIDCSRASTAIYYSNGYDFEDRAQSEDRIVHPTKTEPLLYLDLLTQHTVDEMILDALKQKHTNSRVFMVKLLETWEASYGSRHGRV